MSEPDSSTNAEPELEAEPETSTAGAILTLVVGLLGALGCTGFFVVQAIQLNEIWIKVAERMDVSLPGVTVLALKLAAIWPVVTILMFVGMAIGTILLAFRSHGCMRVVALASILFTGAIPGLIIMTGASYPFLELMEVHDEPAIGPSGGGAVGPGSGDSGTAGSKSSGAKDGAEKTRDRGDGSAR